MFVPELESAMFSGLEAEEIISVKTESNTEGLTSGQNIFQGISDQRITALDTICDNKTLLNQVDMKTKTNTFQHLLEQMAAAGVIDENVLKNLLEKRYLK
ncbi:hypothetical protein WUBG_17402 [Wuchereria bancrofti]|uniref:Uncharacterized protein n=1 Tax=Wuchereria bancrofti TaxID=6293 RepID=J9E423_WUCBA|nr:hypothetical protein WUBG_17402 [Wuchereria bancrofti]